MAADKLGIARLLDVEDIAGNPRPDDKSLIAYLSAFYKVNGYYLTLDTEEVTCLIIIYTKDEHDLQLKMIMFYDNVLY